MKETLEALAAVYAIRLQHVRNVKDDGRESGWEIATTYLDELPVLRRAIKGAGEIPAELLNIQPNDVATLAPRISSILWTWGISHRVQDITAEVLRGIVDLIPVLKEAVRRWDYIMSLPPPALPA